MNPDPDDVTFQFNQVQLSPVDEVADDDVTFGLKRIGAKDESKSVEFKPENLPENDDVDEDGGIGWVLQQLAPEKSPENDDVEDENRDDDVTFNVSEVQIDSKPQQIKPENSPENDDVDDQDDDVTFGSSQAQINTSEQADVDEGGADVDIQDDDVTFGSSQAQINTSEEADVEDEDADVDDEDADVDEEEEEEDDDVEGEEFTFMCINSDNSTTELTEKTVFPLFDQSLLYNHQDGKRINDIHVSNVFIESPRDATSSSSSSSSTSSSITLTAITADSNEMNIKSNSTGFSKLWRFRDDNNINRSNSDGRDAFVFLNPKTEGKTGRKTDGKGKGVKEKVKVSAHEVYMKKAKKGGGGKEEEKRRTSYLPYRPGLMGFFTNVNGGLSKNVHPF